MTERDGSRRPRPSDPRTGARIGTAREVGAGRRSPSRELHRTRDAPGRRLSRSTLWDDEADVPPPQPLRARWQPVPGPEPTPPPERVRPRRRRSRFGWFVHHYGWRAYALPVLAALTVVTIVGLLGSSGAPGPDSDASEAGGTVVTVTVESSVRTTVTMPGPGTTTTVLKGVPASGKPDSDADAPPHSTALSAARTADSVPTEPTSVDGAFDGVALGVLPSGAPFAKTGAGTFHVVPGKSGPIGTGGKTRTFTIEVEDGIENAAADERFADDVMAILSDRRSWVGSGDVTLKRVDGGEPDFRITLTSQMTVREPDHCGWDVQLEASCYNRIPQRVFINDARWVRGSAVYGGDLASYRVYAINHEVGHALGHHHAPCPEDGGLAPVMMQQSWSTSDDDLAKLSPGGPVGADGKVCRYNPFVDPTAKPGSLAD